ncbi:MAG: SGNH/GDSL hydrolase family protein [Bdellovibrionota bacterium]
MKKLIILAFYIGSQGFTKQAMAWPGGLRSSSSFFRGLFGPELKVASFGDSVASGFNSSFWLKKVEGGTYADHFGSWYNQSYDYSVRVRNIAAAGFTLEQIFNSLINRNANRIREADLIFLEGGGNNFLDLNHKKYIDLCKPENFYPTLEKAKSDFFSMMNDVQRYKKPTSRVRVLGIYYPLMNESRTRACVLKSLAPSVHVSFTNALADFNWFLASESKRRGFTYVDTFSRLNCTQKNWSACKPTNYKSLSSYKNKLIELDRLGILRDPGDLGWLQKDRIHPNIYGHSLISWAIRNP